MFGRLEKARVKLACGEEVVVTGGCEVLARLVDGTGAAVGYIVAGYSRADGKRYIGDVALEEISNLRKEGNQDGNKSNDEEG